MVAVFDCDPLRVIVTPLMGLPPASTTRPLIAPSMLTGKPGEKLDSLAVCVAHRACTRTVYAPAAAQAFEALRLPVGRHPESVPSPHSKRYWRL